MTLANIVRVILVLGIVLTSKTYGQEFDFFSAQNESSDVAPILQQPGIAPWETVEGTPADNKVIEDVSPFKKPTTTTESPAEAPTDKPTEPNEADEASVFAEEEINSEAESAPSAHEVKLAELKKLKRIESMLENVIPKVTPCIVSIGETASGVIVKPGGTIITASHVTRKAGRILNVRMHDGRMVKGITLGSNAANDTSAIQLLDSGPWPYLKTVAPDYTAQAGQWCVAFGYPLSWPRDKPASARIGRVTGQYRGKIVTDCPIMGGDSGGALVDLDGNLLGINSSVRLDVTQNLHVSIERYRQDWSYMMSRQDVDIVTAKIATGATGSAVATPVKRTYLGIYAESIRNGVRIRDVRRNSPAEKAALLPEDVIWQIDKTPISSFAELIKYLGAKRGGDQIVVEINRFGVNLEFVVTLEER